MNDVDIDQSYARTYPGTYQHKMCDCCGTECGIDHPVLIDQVYQTDVEGRIRYRCAACDMIAKTGATI